MHWLDFGENENKICSCDTAIRWLRYTTTNAPDCTMSLLESIQPQFVFSVDSDCTSRDGDLEDLNNIIPAQAHEWTEGGTFGATSENNQ